MPSSSGRSGRDKAARRTGGQHKPARRRTGQDNSGKDSSGGQAAGNPAAATRRKKANRPRQDRPDQPLDPPGVPAEHDAAQPGTVARTSAQTSGQGRRRARRMRTVIETSAGGLVVDADNRRAAVIGRLDRRGRLLWSLPKGHIEDGETAEQAAVREVAEETGIAAVVVAALGSIDYWFVADDRRVHKTVHHFLLRAFGGELSDADVEVTAVAWVPLPDLQQQLAYADERRLVRLATELLADPA